MTGQGVRLAGISRSASRMRASRSVSRWAVLAGPSARSRVFLVFIALTFLFGGGSRADIQSLILLRPLASLLAAYALLVGTREQLGAVRAPLVLLGALAALIALQLVPLPPSLWTQFPGREVYPQIYRAAGMELPWLPLAISPARAWNTLFSLVVPFAALVLFAVQEPGRRASLITVVWTAALASVMLGLAQLLSSGTGPLYLYHVTNNGLPVGLFANRNHQALLASIGIVAAACMAARTLLNRSPSATVLSAAGASVLLFVPFLLVVGSRAGLLLGAAMLLPAAYLIYRALSQRQGRQGRNLWRDRRFRLAAVAGAALIGATIVAALAFSRSLAFDRLIATNFEFDYRAAVMPTLVDLTGRLFPIGSGYGGFEAAYKQVEPMRLLMPSYLNHAHNDWLEFVLEGGIAGALLLAAFLGWFVHRVFRLYTTSRGSFDFSGFFAVVAIGAVGAASLVDYPLRVPAIMVVFAICCGLIAVNREKQ